MDTGNSAIFRGSDSRLFVVRMWNEDLGGGQSEWRAYIRHVPSGEVRYVRTWDALENFLDQFNEQPGFNGQSSK